MMKKRLMGLAALLLCLVLTAAPAMSAMAEIKYISPNGLQPKVGDLLNEGMLIDADFVGGASSGGVQYFAKDGTEMENNRNNTIGQSWDLGNHWIVTRYEESINLLSLIDAGTLASGYPMLTAGNALYVFNGVTPPYGYLASKIEDDFKAFFANGTLVTDAAARSKYKMAYYDAAVYHVVQSMNAPEGPNVMGKVSGSMQIRLPLPAGADPNGDVYVLHWSENGVKALSIDRIEDGGVFVTTTCSPFAIVYGTPAGAAASTPPRTGDSAPLALWYALAALSAACMAAVVIRSKKRA